MMFSNLPKQNYIVINNYKTRIIVNWSYIWHPLLLHNEQTKMNKRQNHKVFIKQILLKN